MIPLVPIRTLLSDCFTGDWGSEPGPTGGTPVIRSTNFANEGRLDLTDVVLRKIEPSVLTRKCLRVGDTLLEKSGGGPQQPVGRVVYWDREIAAVCSNFIQVCRPNEKDNLPRFIFYLLDHLYRSGVTLQFQQQTTGLMNLKLHDFLQVAISRPDRDAQSAIALLLTTIDHVIDQTETLLSKQQRIKIGLMYDLLTRGVDANGRLRDPETQPFKKSPWGRIPVEWRLSALADCTSRITVGLATSVTKHYRNKGVPIVRNLNIRRGFLDDSDLVFLDPQFAARFPNKSLRYRDVITCRTGANVGDTCLVPESLANSQTFTTLITTTKKEELMPEFLVDYLASDLGQKELGNVLVGAGKDNLNAGQFREVRVPLPDLKEQQDIHVIIKAINHLIRREEAWRDKLLLLKMGLMEDLLTGRVSVAPLLSLPAELPSS